MKVVHFVDAPQFLGLVSTVFSDQEVRYNLLLSLVKRVADNPHYYEETPLMAAVYAGDQVILAALMTNPPCDLLLASTQEDTADALAILADDLWQRGLILHGINAEKQHSAAFASLWCKRGTFRAAIKTRLRIYRLDQVIYPQPAEGFLRKAASKDRLLLRGWKTEFMKETLGEEDAGRSEKLVDLLIRWGNLYVWEDGQVVCMAAKIRETQHGAVIGMVYTPQASRNRGYASNLVAALSERFLKQGYPLCALFTDLANPTSNAIYQQIGYKPVADTDQYVFV